MKLCDSFNIKPVLQSLKNSLKYSKIKCHNCSCRFKFVPFINVYFVFHELHKTIKVSSASLAANLQRDKNTHDHYSCFYIWICESQQQTVNLRNSVHKVLMIRSQSFLVSIFPYLNRLITNYCQVSSMERISFRVTFQIPFPRLLTISD